MKTNNITVSQSKLKSMIAAGVTAALAVISTTAAAPVAAAPEPTKRGPGRPKKVTNEALTVQGPKAQGSKAQGATVKPSNVIPITDAKRRGREPVVGPLMHEAMSALFEAKKGTEVSFEELKSELEARSKRVKDPIPAIPEATIRNYLGKMNGELWDRVSYGKYVPRKVA